MRFAVLCGLAAAILCFTLPACGENKGGIYLDDIVLTNNATTVFADNFNTGKTTGWRIPKPLLVTPFQLSKTPANYCVYMNRQHELFAEMDRCPFAKNIGNLDLKTIVYMPSNKEQWNTTNGLLDRTRINFYMGDKEDWFYVSIDSKPRDNGYRIQLTHVNPREINPVGCGGAGKDYDSNGTVIPAAAWAELRFRLDTKTKTAAVYVNGQSVVSAPYDPSLVHTLTLFNIRTWMGDQQPTATPGKCIQPNN